MILRNMEQHEGVKVDGYNINNLRYVDDTVLIADSEEKSQNILTTVTIKSENKGLQLDERRRGKQRIKYTDSLNGYATKIESPNNKLIRRTDGGVGSTVACESALRSAGTLLSRVRAPLPAPWPDGGPESLRSSCCGLAIYKKNSKKKTQEN
ncbi:retrovirus-related pol polyprotein from type-1 retrotransposable element r2 [Plakobranchus ocellatus]|uniref:Retrovirus-related pol polyprotein from type-1 retrotransposable element r2 n=1 Tax=Plakobranchus ocellatus TaxID=259542 RepID=A0AAV3YRY8_9GAST|nr:retrovirus-related pol polyprotein from type-1 retrotransposable element r2 [Plakobranchus ocellatus]